MSSFAKRLDRVLREVNVAELAKVVHVDPSAISHWRKGRRSPDPDMVGALCREIPVSADYLLGVTPRQTTRDEGTLLRVANRGPAYAPQHETTLNDLVRQVLITLTEADEDLLHRLLNSATETVRAHRKNAERNPHNGIS